MIDLEKSLKINLGFSAKIAQIYLALLELGEATVIDIAKKTGLKRTTVYNLLPELLEQGYANTILKKKKKLFLAGDPNSLKRALEEKEKAIDQLLPELRAIHNVLPYKPKVTFYEGFGGMRELYQDTLNCVFSGDTIFSFTGLANFYNLVPKDYSRYYIEERIKKKIKVKIISPDSEVAREWQKNSPQELREIKTLKKSVFNFNADMEIYGDKIALISYRDNFLGVIIESKEISQMQRAAFELMWNSI